MWDRQEWLPASVRRSWIEEMLSDITRNQVNKVVVIELFGFLLKDRSKGWYTVKVVHCEVASKFHRVEMDLLSHELVPGAYQ